MSVRDTAEASARSAPDARLIAHYLDYVAAFNAKDLERVGRYLDSDLRFDWAGAMPDFFGAAEMLAFYEEAWKHVDEHLTIHATRVEGPVITATLTNRLQVHRDWPASPLRSLRTAGRPFELSGAMRYEFRDGLISHISEAAAPADSADESGTAGETD